MKALDKVFCEITPPDGEYNGFWSGYVVRFTVNEQKFHFDTDRGVRGKNIPVNICIKNGEVSFEPLNRNQSS